MCGQRLNQSNKMKAKLSLIMILGLMACTLAGIAQNNPADQSATTSTPASVSDASAQPADTQTPAATPDAATATAQPAAASDSAPAAPQAPAVAAATDASSAPAATAAETPAKSADAAATPAATATSLPEAPVVAANQAPATAPAADTNQPPATTPAADTNQPPATTPAQNAGTPQPGAVIPLIVMDDVPLTDAIKNLARQAGLNYMLDPKIGFGQVGPDGKVVAQPSVSIRWENITAEQALNALLNNYSLQLMEDPKTHIARITVRDPAAPDPLQTRIIQLAYATPTNIVSAVQTALTDKRSKVTADVRTSQLVVVATEKEQTETRHRHSASAH